MRGKGEGSIYKDKRGRWRGAVSLPNGKRRYVSGRTRREVSVKVARLQEQVLTGSLAAPGRLTVAGFMERWLAEHVRPNRAPKTSHGYAEVVRLYIVPHVGRVPLARLTPAHVQGMLAALTAGGKSARTVEYAHGVLSRALNVAVRWELIPRNPAAAVTPPAPARRERDFLSVDQARRLLAALEGDRLRPLYLLGLSLGLRRGEALGLTWADVNLEDATVTVRRSLVAVGPELVESRPKTPESWATLPLPDFAVTALREHRARQLEERLRAGAAWRETGYVFTTAVGTPIAPRNLLRHWYGVLHRAGLPRMPFHALRHSAASLLLAQGVPLRTVQQVLRHSKVSLTADLYGHLTLDVTREAVRGMDALLGGP